jgi:hypothetical protein
MRKVMLAIAFLVLLPSFAYGQSGFNGTWITTDFKDLDGAPAPIYLNFRVDATKVTGTVSRQDVEAIRNGTVNGDTIAFNAISANGERTVSFVGKLKGDTITFTRSVRVNDKDGNRGPGIFGGKGPMQFTAKRDPSASTGLEAHYGNWKLNLAKSHYEPALPSQDVVPQVLAFRAMGDGKVGLAAISANPIGTPIFDQTVFKADGNDYPLYTPASLDTIIAGGRPTFETNSVKVIDENTMEVTFKRNSVPYDVLRQAVSPDGQTLTETWKDVDPSGRQTASAVEVYQRIP